MVDQQSCSTQSTASCTTVTTSADIVKHLPCLCGPPSHSLNRYDSHVLNSSWSESDPRLVRDSSWISNTVSIQQFIFFKQFTTNNLLLCYFEQANTLCGTRIHDTNADCVCIAFIGAIMLSWMQCCMFEQVALVLVSDVAQSEIF